MRHRTCWLVLLLLCCVPACSIAATWRLHGKLENASAYFVSGAQRWDKIQNRLQLEPEAAWGDWQFRARALAWYDAAMDIEATRPPDLTASIKRYYRLVAQCKEAYLFYEGDAFDLRLGRQQVVWGKTDGLRLLDIVNPLDMREFILDDFLDSRIGVTAARLSWYPDTALEQEFEFLLLPDAKPARAAPLGSRWAFALPPLPPGMGWRLLPSSRPNWAPGNMEAGFAWRANLAGWDVSLNYFHGWKDTPNTQRQWQGNRLDVRLAYFRMHTLGASFSNAFGPFVLRGEMAANLGESLDRQALRMDASVTRKNTWNAALALEWTKYGWDIASQLFWRRIQAWDAALLEPRDSGFWTLRAATDFLHETLKPEMLFIGDWAAGGWLLRAKLAYEWSDRVSSSLGADIFGGHRGLLGQFAANDRISAEVAYTF